MSLSLSDNVEVGVDVVRVKGLSSSSGREGSDLREPNKLGGLTAFCRTFAFVFGINRSRLVLELTDLSELSEVVGLGAPLSIPPSVEGELDSGLEKPKGAVRRFFCNMVGDFAGWWSSMGVNGDRVGRRMLKLFLRRRSDMVLSYICSEVPPEAQAKEGRPVMNGR